MSGWFARQGEGLVEDNANEGDAGAYGLDEKEVVKGLRRLQRFACDEPRARRPRIDDLKDANGGEGRCSLCSRDRGVAGEAGPFAHRESVLESGSRREGGRKGGREEGKDGWR